MKAFCDGNENKSDDSLLLITQKKCCQIDPICLFASGTVIFSPTYEILSGTVNGNWLPDKEIGRQGGKKLGSCNNII